MSAAGDLILPQGERLATAPWGSAMLIATAAGVQWAQVERPLPPIDDDEVEIEDDEDAERDERDDPEDEDTEDVEPEAEP